jgi:aminoglycoside 3-N-acetyltransferase
MKEYNTDEIKKALIKIGLKKNDNIFINPEIYRLGNLAGINRSEDLFKIFFNLIMSIIGKNGTLSINSYTFQTLRYKKKFIHEKTKSSSGNFSEYIRELKGAIRSKHPVFSVTSFGKFSKIICQNNSFHNYGYNSPYWKFIELNGYILNIGMDPWLNPFNHVAEYLCGVPYHYNKLTSIPYYKGGRKHQTLYSSNVRYLDLKIKYDYLLLKKKINKLKIIKSIKLGNGYMHMVNVKKYFFTLTEILSKNQFAIVKKINFRKNIYPFK